MAILDATLINDLRTVAQESVKPSIRRVINDCADSLERTRQEDYSTLSNWAAKKTLADGVTLTEEGKRVLGAMLDRLLELHKFSRCHGNLEPTNVMVSETDVKLINPNYLPYSLENVRAEYLNMVKLLRFFRLNFPGYGRLTEDVRYLWDYLSSDTSVILKNPIIIFNPACVWDTRRISMVVAYLGNRMRRNIRNEYACIEAAARDAAGETWISQIPTTNSLFPKWQNEKNLLKFMQRIYGHPPEGSVTFGTLRCVHVKTPDQIGEEFHRMFPQFFCKLVERLLLDDMVRPGDVIDWRCAGSVNW